MVLDLQLVACFERIAAGNQRQEMRQHIPQRKENRLFVR